MIDIFDAAIAAAIAKGSGGGGGTSNVQGIHMEMSPLTFVLTTWLIDGEGTKVGQEQTIDLPLEATIVGASYDNVTKDLTFTLASGGTLTVPLDDIIYGLQPLIDSQHKLSASLVDDTQGRYRFTWVGTAAQYAVDSATMAVGTPVIITDDVDMDTVPTQGSDNPVTSGGLYTAFAAKEDKADHVVLAKSDFDDLVSKTAKLYYVYPDPTVSNLQSLTPSLQPISLDVVDTPAETEVLTDDSSEDR